MTAELTETRASTPGDSLVDRAYNTIVSQIVADEITQTDVLSHRQLALRLGMSRLPVAMALDRLEREGRVESSPRIGTRLKPADADSVWNEYQWRIAVECQTARLASQLVTPEDGPRLLGSAEKVDRIQEASLASQIQDDHQSDVDFHQLVAELSMCRRLKEELVRLDIFRLKMRSCEIVQAARVPLDQSPPGHRAVAEAILSGDEERAVRTMRDHLVLSPIYGFLQWYLATQREARNGKGTAHA